MGKLEINALFYSKQNIGVGYDLKKACNEIGISLIYAFEIPELVKYLTEFKVGIVFVDCTTLLLNENIVAFIKSYSNSKNSLVICLCDNECPNINKLKDDGIIDYIIFTTKLLSQLKDLENKIYYEIAKNDNNYFDYSKVNTFMTDYLLKVGIAPKHIGFTYIKQIIELALKNNANIGSLSKDIYPTIATKNGTQPQNVERNVRNAIECACRNSDLKTSRLNLLVSNGKISNRAFLCYLLDLVLNEFSNKKN